MGLLYLFYNKIDLSTLQFLVQSLCVCGCIYNSYADVPFALIWRIINNHLSECRFVRIVLHNSAAAPLLQVHSSLSEYADERIIEVHNLSETAPSSGKRKGFCTCNVIRQGL